MKKFISLTLLVFMLLGLGMSYATQPVDKHNHGHEKSEEIMKPLGVMCPYCESGTITHRYTAPTCTKSGSDVYDCNNCSYYDNDYIPALGHDWQSYSTFKVCATCGIVVYY